MKIIDRYLISQFLKPLAVCGAIFTILVFVGHFFDKMEIFNRFHAHVADIVVYLVLGLPYWLNIIFPVATLLALMFSLGPLQQRGEITAMRNAGISSVRLYAPFLAMGVLISLISLIGGLTFFPSINAKANVLYRQHIKQEQVNKALRDHIVATGRDHQRFIIGTLDTKMGAMTNIVIDQFDNQMHLLSTLSAQQGRYQNGQWTFNRGNFVQFDANGRFQQAPFQEKVLNIHEKPEDFIYEDRKPDDMTHSEILRRIRHLNELGVPSFKEQVALQLQFALPFANVMVILLGIPFAISSLQKGNVRSVAYALGATFLYWGTVSVFQSYGEQGHLPGWVSAWAANFIFGILAVWMLQRTMKF
jgi:lipopolysaccharide export system permease protein